MSQRSSFDVPDSRRQSVELGGSHLNVGVGIRDQFPPLMSPIAETTVFGAEQIPTPMQERRASLSLHFSATTSASTPKSETSKLQRSATTIRPPFQRVNSPRLAAPVASGPGSKRARVTKPLWLKKRQTNSVDIPDVTSEQDW